MTDPTLQFGATDADKIYKDKSNNNDFVFQIRNNLVATMADNCNFLTVEGPISVNGNATFNGEIDGVSLLEIDQATAPGTVTDKLYNVSGELFWGGLNLSQSAGGLIQDFDQNTIVATETVSDAIIMTTAGNERMRITSNGRIGLGTDTPQVGLDIQQGDVKIGVTSFQYYEATGNIGIGVTNPLYLLQVGGNSGYEGHLIPMSNQEYDVGVRGTSVWGEVG